MYVIVFIVVIVERVLFVHDDPPIRDYKMKDLSHTMFPFI